MTSDGFAELARLRWLEAELDNCLIKLKELGFETELLVTNLKRGGGLTTSIETARFRVTKILKGE